MTTITMMAITMMTSLWWPMQCIEINEWVIVCVCFVCFPTSCAFGPCLVLWTLGVLGCLPAEQKPQDCNFSNMCFLMFLVYVPFHFCLIDSWYSCTIFHIPIRCDCLLGHMSFLCKNMFKDGRCSRLDSNKKAGIPTLGWSLVMEHFPYWWNNGNQ